MGFLKGIAHGIGHIAKLELAGLKHTVTTNPLTTAKELVNTYKGTANKHGWWAWTPPGNAISAIMDVMKQAAPKKAPTADRPIHGKF
ncbi:MAG: hypothetical protein K1X89_29925 [Myxococcaceae bacterium]|nr:hypothetical protein [Myxococcaceae bacterium]